jgi:hypothetical protein
MVFKDGSGVAVGPKLWYRDRQWSLKRDGLRFFYIHNLSIHNSTAFWSWHSF